jgi:2,3-bisphosphoglycerate-dependent phosphoglycerate mutase
MPGQDGVASPEEVGLTTTMLERVLLAGECAPGELVLVRHGQQGVNDLGDPARPKAGDAPLSELGRRQADAVAAELARGPVDAVYCSPLRRAHETGQRIAERQGLEPVVDARLVEVGIFRGLPRGATVAGQLGAAGQAALERDFSASHSWAAFPLSESRPEIDERLGAALDHILARHPEDSRIVVACHGGVINALIRRVIGSDRDMLVYPAHASITRLARGGGRLALSTVNEMHHLRHRADVELTY